jgi:hypothetical protein
MHNLLKLREDQLEIVGDLLMGELEQYVDRPSTKRNIFLGTSVTIV